MRPSDFVRLLPGLIAAQQPAFLWGAPGIGKSSIIAQVAASMNRPLIDIRAAQFDPVDLRGLPHVNAERRVEWLAPSFFPTDPASKAIIHFDELPGAAPAVQKACLQLFLDRRLGEYVLPKGVYVLAAGNRREDAAGVNALITPLANRFTHYTLEVSYQDWAAYALANGIDGRVLSFIDFRRDMLMQFDAKSGANAFPTPRSWEFVSRLLNQVPDDLMMDTVAGCVGRGAAAEFMAHYELFSRLPVVGDIMRQPDTYEIGTELSVLYALSQSLVEWLKEPKHDAEAWSRFVVRLPKEIALLSIVRGKNIRPTLYQTKAIDKWIDDNGELLTSAVFQ